MSCHHLDVRCERGTRRNRFELQTLWCGQCHKRFYTHTETHEVHIQIVDTSLIPGSAVRKFIEAINRVSEADRLGVPVALLKD
jgi:formate-dependent nitrite reductase cytochrome c552 subunit